MNKTIQRKLKRRGLPVEISRACGVSRQAVSVWISSRRIPAERVLAVESATGISRHDLRPDIYPR